MKIPKIEELDTPKKMGSLYLKKRYPEFYEYLCNKYKDFNVQKTTEMIYLYYNELEEPHKCPVCGKHTHFLDYNRGYQNYCSLKCSNSDPEVKAKKEATSIKNYGVAHAAQNKEVKERQIKTYVERHGGMGNASQGVKAKQYSTMKELYGSEYALRNPELLKKSQDTLESHYGVRHPFHSQELKERSKQTNIERYGVEYGLMADKVRERIKNTNLERYGVESNLSIPTVREQIKKTNIDRFGVATPFESGFVREKVKATNLERYGFENPSQNPEIKQKSKQTSLKRYGVDNPSKSQEIIDKIIESRRSAAIDKIENLLGYTENGDWVRKCPHPECNKCEERNYVIPRSLYVSRNYQGTELCTRLLPIQDTHHSGTTIELFVRVLLDEHHIEYVTNDRTVLNGKELDIYIPSHNLAIECNGVYWHSANKKDSKYHFDKYVQCREAGIQLLTIWEDQIINKPEVVKSIILSKLGIYSRRIGARECTLEEIPAGLSKQFLNSNHLQGSVISKYNIGLFYKGELVSVMTFGKKRRALGNKANTPTEFELYRYCTLGGTQVVGGASKLFKYFVEHYNPTTIESFSSNDISDGGLYESLGFTRVNEMSGSYWYIDENMKRYHRFNFTKGKLVKMGADASLTETQITAQLGFTRIYDSGQTKWMLKQ